MKCALIIGGSSGIGLATVKKLAAHGFNVVCIHRDRRQDAENFQRTLADLSKTYQVQLKPYNIDATNVEKIKSCIQELVDEKQDKFNLVLHAVSRGNLKPFTGDLQRLSQQDLLLTVDAMGFNLHTWISELYDQSLIGSGTRIITLTSEGNKRFWDGYGAVAMAKSAMETMANYLAVELAAKGMTVNVIQAGVTETPSLRLIPGSDKLMEETKARNPFKRMTTPEDVANFIYLLSLPEADWINGSMIHVDGGEHLL